MIEIYTKHNLAELNWAEVIITAEEKCFLSKLVQLNSTDWIFNLNCEFCLLKINEFILPMSISQNNYTNTYVNSIYTHYISYALEEINKIHNIFLRSIACIIINILGLVFKYSKINNCIYLNNLNISTNLYSESFTDKYIKQITEYIKKYYPKHAIVFRSLNKQIVNNSFLEELQNLNYKQFASRQIYLTNTLLINPLQKKDCKNDLKLLNKHDYKIITDKTIISQYIPQILKLYNYLYIQKYSKFNPQFTQKFLKICLESNFFEFYLFQNNTTNQIDAVLGFYTINKIMTAPILGYNPSLSLTTGLYRRLVILLIKICTERKNILHSSSGVGKFKASRGGKRDLEFSAIYYQHLPLSQKIAWFILKNLLKPFEYCLTHYDF